jgi:hypothetical protein
MASSSIDSMSHAELVDAALSLQNALSDLSSRVEAVKAENETIRTENTVLKDYIDNLLSKVTDEHTKAQLSKIHSTHLFTHTQTHTHTQMKNNYKNKKIKIKKKKC